MGLLQALLIRIFLKNWPRKLVAFLGAIVIWFLVNQTLSTTVSFANISVRLINLPSDKTVKGLYPNGKIPQKIPLVITGAKSALSHLSAQDLELVINAEGRDQSFMAHIDKRNLSLPLKWDLKTKISDASADDFFVELQPKVTHDIPVKILKGGDLPKGYQFLVIWPKELKQTVSGSEEEIFALREKGLELVLPFNQISKEELDLFSEGLGILSFPIPQGWKQVAIPFRENTLEELNDPKSNLLRINFLKVPYIEDEDSDS